MGTWDTGPFDSDDAAELLHALARATPADCRRILGTALAQAQHPDHDSHNETLAAAALVADRCAPAFPARVHTLPSEGVDTGVLPLDELPDLNDLVPDAIAGLYHAHAAVDFEGWSNAALEDGRRERIDELLQTLNALPRTPAGIPAGR
ncbi:DUF4259 domain-containing protein [Kitasatospora sp. NPDC088783]|uniref:DUF4259 domain-containing protein n=1 Tax=Kitasatospora sp. NPDC088783 TaxID=3364077 RepID=UPI0037FCF304